MYFIQCKASDIGENNRKKQENKRNYLNITLACLSGCLFVSNINVKTAEPIGPNFFVGHHVTTGKVYE